MQKAVTPFQPRAWLAAAGALVLLALGARAGAAPAAAQSSAIDSASLAGVTGVGIHNTYNDKTDYTYLADALDSGASLIELDAWANVLNGKWDVSHDDPLASDNNCVQASTYAGLYTGDRNQNLGSCLDDIRIWMLAHPAHGPIMVKIEMKNGFDDTLGLDPTEFDSYVRAHLGSVLYTPADLLTKPDGSLYPNLDAAAQADNWGTYGSLEGKVIVEIIPGTFEQAVDPSSTWVDVVYARGHRRLRRRARAQRHRPGAGRRPDPGGRAGHGRRLVRVHRLEHRAWQRRAERRLAPRLTGGRRPRVPDGATPGTGVKQPSGAAATVG
jgi:hypothetical protein